jgi:hypothetical protein
MNLQKMMKQAQEMQTRITGLQAKMEAEEGEGSSGGGLVNVRVNGKGLALAISIDSKLMEPSEKEMLEDLVVAAFNDAKNKMEERMAAEMSKITAGMPLPPGFKLPL